MAFPWVALAIGVSTLVSFAGSRQQQKNLRRAAKNDKIKADTIALQQNIEAAKRARLFSGEIRARRGASGTRVGQESNLMQQKILSDNLADTKQSILLSANFQHSDIDNQLLGSLATSYYNTYGSLLKGIGDTYEAGQNFKIRQKAT